jgi:adenylate cyclase
MDVNNRHELEETLANRQRELDLIMAIDAIRDSGREPSSMLSAIVNLIADELSASLCMLALVDRDTGELELRAVNDRGPRLGSMQLDSIRGLAWRGVKVSGVEVWTGGEVCEALGIPAGSPTQLAVVPIVAGSRVRLGVLMATRDDRAFSEADRQLLRVAESQLDSAVIQGYDYYELALRNKELETIYRVDRIRDKNLPFDEMLNAVLEELRGVIEAEMGYIMLYDRVGKKLELRAFSHDDLFRVAGYYDAIDSISSEALKSAHLVFYNDLPGSLPTIMCIPLILRDEILGVFGVANTSGRRFEERERRLLTAIASQMDTAIFESLEQRRLRRVLGRSVDPHVMERLLANPDVDFLRGERQLLTVLYADIRGSTSLAERTGPEALVGFINDYLGRMTEVIFEHEGTLDKFIGDEVMALFGAPIAQPDHALRAVRVGLKMQEVQQKVIEDWRARGVDAAPIGVGIATGELIVGELGSAYRTDYTALGRAANLGSRICAAAQPGQVLISQETFDMVADQVIARPIKGLEFKGVIDPVTVYHVTAEASSFRVPVGESCALADDLVCRMPVGTQPADQVEGAGHDDQIIGAGKPDGLLQRVKRLGLRINLTQPGPPGRFGQRLGGDGRFALDAGRSRDHGVGDAGQPLDNGIDGFCFEHSGDEYQARVIEYLRQGGGQRADLLLVVRSIQHNHRRGLHHLQASGKTGGGQPGPQRLRVQ